MFIAVVYFFFFEVGTFFDWPFWYAKAKNKMVDIMMAQ